MGFRCLASESNAMSIPCNRRYGVATATLVGALALLGAPGCDEAEDFRGAARASLETGVDALADGLIDGFFAVFEPEADSETTE